LCEFTHSDIIFTSNLQARFSNYPKKKKKKKKKTHTKLIIKTLRYLMGIVYWGITFIKEKDFKFYTDADYNIPMYNWWNLHIFLL